MFNVYNTTVFTRYIFIAFRHSAFPNLHPPHRPQESLSAHDHFSSPHIFETRAESCTRGSEAMV